MPTYQITAPNGLVYQIPGPDGATDEEIKAQVLAQHPDAAGPEPGRGYSGTLSDILRGGAEGPAKDYYAGVPGEIREAPPPLLEAAGHVLPVLGAMGGGVLGTGAGPIGAVAGSALGYEAGRQTSELGRTLWNYLRGQPVNPGTPLEQAGNMLQGLATGAAWEAGGQLAGKALAPITEILRDAGLLGSPASGIATQAAAERLGVPLPASVGTESHGLAKVEAMPRYFMTSANPANQFFRAPGLAMQRAGERLAQSAGPDVGAEAAGLALKGDVTATANAAQLAAARSAAASQGQDAALQAAEGQRLQQLVEQYSRQFGAAPESSQALGQQIQDALELAQNQARGRVAPLFEAARAEAAAGSDIPLTGTRDVAEQILALEQRLGSLGRRGPAGAAATADRLTAPPPGPAEPAVIAQNPTLHEQFIRQFGLNEPAPVAPDLALELSKRLAAQMRNAPDDVTRRSLGQLRTALEGDISTWANATGNTLGPLRQQAAEAYRTQVVPYYAEDAPLRQRVMDAEPEAAAKALLSLGDASLVRQAMSQLPEPMQQRIRAAVFNQFRGQDPAAFEAALSRMGTGRGRMEGDALSALLTPNQLTGLEGLRGQLRTAAENPVGFVGPHAQYQAPEGFLGKIPDLQNVAGLVQSLTSGPNKSIQQFDQVWNAATPETQSQIRSEMLNRVFRSSREEHVTGAAIDKPGGQFSISRMTTALKDTPPEIWKRVLDEDQQQLVRDLMRVGEKTIEYARGAAQPSGNIQAALSIGQGLSVIHALHSYATGNSDAVETAGQIAATLGGPYYGAKALYSPRVQRLLMRPAGAGGVLAPESLGALTKMLGLRLSEPSEP